MIAERLRPLVETLAYETPPRAVLQLQARQIGPLRRAGEVAMLEDLADVVRGDPLDDHLGQFGDRLGGQPLPDGLVQIAEFQFAVAEGLPPRRRGSAR